MKDTHLLIPSLMVLIMMPYTAGHEKRLVLDDAHFDDNTIQSLKQDIEMLKKKKHARGGVSYVRWGRTVCDGNNDTQLVYSGFMGGSLYLETGGAAEYVCLPPNPQWGPKSNQIAGAEAHMYGTEYEDNTLYGFAAADEDAPCSVCVSHQHTIQLMIPGRTDCYSGWSRAYVGYLSTGAAVQESATQYVCIDEHPEANQGGENRNDNGKLLYGVKTVCGSLPCPPYHADKVLSCVVCLL